jgi:hypothetical protein
MNRRDGGGEARSSVQPVDFEMVSGGQVSRLLWWPCTASLLKLAVGSSLLFARAQARGRLGFTAPLVAALVLLMPVVWWMVIRSTRAGMARRREIVRFRLRSDEWRRLGAGLASKDGQGRMGYFFLRSERYGLALLAPGGHRVSVESVDLEVRPLVTRRGAVIGVRLAKGDLSLCRYGVGPSIEVE